MPLASSISFAVRRGEFDVLIGEYLLINGQERCVKYSSRCYDHLISGVSVKLSGQSGGLGNDPCVQWNDRNTRIGDGFLDPSLYVFRKAEVSNLHRLRYFPQGDSADSQPYRLVFRNYLRKSRR
jgi:hypothetical protein